MELSNTLLTDYNDLFNVRPIQNEVIIRFIEDRKLPVIVDEQGGIYFKQVGIGERSYNRALQELQATVLRITNKQCRRFPVDAAAFESYLAKRETQSVGAVEQDVNQKVEDLLNAMIARRASDLHIKVMKDEDLTTIRMRINGELVPYSKLNYAIGDALLRALWVSYAGAKRDEGATSNASFYYKPKTQPQREFMVRMTESPEVRGMMFVARIRDPREIRPLEEIGYNKQQLQVVEALGGNRKGLASINGPTNSGKSSTQSSIIARMPQTMHIVEIGDPVETYQDHVAHLELSESFPGGKMAHLEQLLSATVRQDPDILALTEMRDALTAKAALQLASQGKFVITTMHTTDFVSAFERFQRMGLTREDLVAPGFLRGLVSQKLIPKICPNCSLTNAASDSATLYYQHIFGADMGKVRFRNRDGCPECNHTGIVDRVIVAEAVEITNDLLPIIKSILFKADPAPFYDYAQKKGILNIHQHAYERVIAGEIDPAMTESEIGRFGSENLHHYWQRGV